MFPNSSQIAAPVQIANRSSRLEMKLKSEIAREYEKTIFILQFLNCDGKDIATRIRDNEYGLTEEDFGMLLNIQHNYFDPYPGAQQ